MERKPFFSLTRLFFHFFLLPFISNFSFSNDISHSSLNLKSLNHEDTRKFFRIPNVSFLFVTYTSISNDFIKSFDRVLLVSKFKIYREVWNILYCWKMSIMLFLYKMSFQHIHRYSNCFLFQLHTSRSEVNAIKPIFFYIFWCLLILME